MSSRSPSLEEADKTGIHACFVNGVKLSIPAWEVGRLSFGHPELLVEDTPELALNLGCMIPDSFKVGMKIALWDARKTHWKIGRKAVLPSVEFTSSARRLAQNTVQQKLVIRAGRARLQIRQSLQWHSNKFDRKCFLPLERSLWGELESRVLSRHEVEMRLR